MGRKKKEGWLINTVAIMGRLVRDPEIRTSQGGTKVARYTLAVNRSYRKEGDPEADFISCIAFGAKADFAEKYMAKGRQFAVCGHIQTGSYEKDGVRHYTTDIVVDSQYFADSKPSQQEAAPQQRQPGSFPQAPRTTQPQIDDFVPDEDDDESLPF